ncbi:hypothetical protein IP88_07080 [alpha proteobacterium AAP81b]|nr:hypothetical protein IP88_07080 [alpha proteobacterium AAP81b]
MIGLVLVLLAVIASLWTAFPPTPASPERAPPSPRPRQPDNDLPPYAAGEAYRQGRADAEAEAAAWTLANDPGEVPSAD